MPEDFFATAAQAHPMPKQDRENTVKAMKEELSESTQLKTNAYEVQFRGVIELLEKLLKKFEDQTLCS